MTLRPAGFGEGAFALGLATKLADAFHDGTPTNS